MIYIYNIIDITIVNYDARTQRMDIVQLIVIVAITEVVLGGSREKKGVVSTVSYNRKAPVVPLECPQSCRFTNFCFLNVN